MLAKATPELPLGDVMYEPKWDGFRCVVFRDGDDVELGSRNQKPLTRYFPDLLDPIRERLPQRCVLDGEIVVPAGAGLNFDLLQQRIHPAESRVNMLAEQTPASFVAFDLLALDDRDLRPEPFRSRRSQLEQVLRDAAAPIHLTPATTDPDQARDWFERFEGSGLDGIIAKPLDNPYVEDKRVQFKVKHHRTADCVVGGYRVHKDGGVGSLLLGLFDRPGHPNPQLHHIGVCSAFSAARRRTLVGELAAFETDALDGHPWASWADPAAHEGSPEAPATRMPGAPSRWTGTRDLDWVPLRCELVAEVTYENVGAGRFRHPARFVRWRPDKAPTDCTYEQIDQPPAAELQQIFATELS